MLLTPEGDDVTGVPDGVQGIEYAPHAPGPTS
jgi:hypothetical protein